MSRAPISIGIAYEDVVSEAVIVRLLSLFESCFVIGPRFHKGGFGYLKHLAPGFNDAARSYPFFMLTDLDTRPCAPVLIQSWISKPLNSKFLFRVAIREVETWLMADRKGFSGHFKVPLAKLPDNPENLDDPKKFFFSLIRNKHARRLRDMLPDPDGTASQGPGYNLEMVDFVRHQWDPLAAQENSDSLRRAIHRLATLCGKA